MAISEDTMNELVSDINYNGDYEVSCRKCKAVITKDSFKDRLSLRMFNLVGYCQECQDAVFNNNDEIRK